MAKLATWKIAFLASLACGALAATACSSDSDPDEDIVGTGGANGTGATSSTGSTGPGGGDGTGGTADNNPCEGEVKVATGSPALIDDFSAVSGGEGGAGGAGSTVGALPENDGRFGQWMFSHYLNAAGTPAGAENGALHFSSETAGYEVAAWDSANPWQQWASASTGLQMWADPANCYDASVFTGVKFKASSASATADKIRLQFSAPGANTETGETFNCPEITLTSTLDEYEVAFSTCKIPSWSTATNKDLPVNALETLQFVVRSVEAQSEGAIMGETLTAWDITIDDVEFY